jgi:hypothetical protein
MQVGSRPDRSDFTVAEEPGEGQVSKDICQCSCVMAFAPEQASATARARKQQYSQRAGQAPGQAMTSLQQISVGRLGVAELELNRLPDSGISAYRQCSHLRVGSQYVPDQEVALLKVLDVL